MLRSGAGWAQATLGSSWWTKLTAKDRRSLLAELKVTKSFERGKELHAAALDGGLHLNLHVATALLKMYSSCGSIVLAREVFDGIRNPDVASWNALILGYAENGEGAVALDLFKRMKSEGCLPDCITYVAALKACTSFSGLKQDANAKSKCKEQGRKIHSEIGSHSNAYVQSTLIHMYAKCGSMHEARRVFDSIDTPSVVSWSTLILGYVDNGEASTALDMFATMRMRCQPNGVTYMAAIKACSSLALKHGEKGRAELLERGRQIHSEIGCHSDEHVQCTLIDMYSKCRSMEDALRVFEGMRSRTLAPWHALILGYAENGQGRFGLEMYTRMRTQGYKPNFITFVAALKACAALALQQNEKPQCLELGKQIHLEIGWHSNVYVQSALIDMYAKCGSMIDAHKVFDAMKHHDEVSGTALILGYAENKDGAAAWDLFLRMRRQGYEPDRVTVLAGIKACAQLAVEQDPLGKLECLAHGKQLHSEISCFSDLYVQCTLIDMYAKCGAMIEARQVFDSLEEPDVVSWNSLILGYVENGECITALDLFARMKRQGCLPDSVTYIGVFRACALLAALETGRKFHLEMKPNVKYDAILVTCIVDFYAKCGSLAEAQKVFDSHPSTRCLRTWNALLAGYGRSGDDLHVLRLIEGMKDAGFQPDGVTYLCLLTCCSHAGLVKEAKKFFAAMSSIDAVALNIDHYTCMIDILGRSNKLDDAMALLRSIPLRLNVVTWLTVLGVCLKWKHVEIGMLAFKSLVCLEEGNATSYVLMARIYQSKGMLQEQEMVLRMGSKYQVLNTTLERYWTTNPISENVHASLGLNNLKKENLLT